MFSDEGYKEIATFFDKDFIVVAVFTAALLVFNVVGSVFVYRGHWVRCYTLNNVGVMKLTACWELVFVVRKTPAQSHMPRPILCFRFYLSVKMWQETKAEQGTEKGERAERRQRGRNNNCVYIFLCCEPLCTPQYYSSLSFLCCIIFLINLNEKSSESRASAHVCL